MDPADKNRFYFDSLEIIENILAMMAKKELEIKELYQRLEEYDKKYPRSPLEQMMSPASEVDRFRIIIADSLPAMRMRLKEILIKDGGCAVAAEAADGRDLMAKYIEHRPSLIVADIELPTTTEGYKALKQIRSSDPNVNIIVISRELDEETLLKVMEIGAYDFISKPINHRRLIHNIEKIRLTA
jgi:PleD family two-component response regulator